MDLESTIDQIESTDNKRLIEGYKKLKYYWNRDKRTSELVSDLFDANIIESKISKELSFKQDVEGIVDS